MTAEFPTVAASCGRLRGRRTGAVCAFLGIPYAAAPVGALRWRPPQALAPWSGVRDALAFGPDPLQPPGAVLRGARQDEDCLYLNVWTPAPEAGAKLPVLVWMPGGGFVGGSGSEAHNDGAALAAEGAVVVTVNYRCGLFGFLAHPSLSAESAQGVSGNYGLLDQMAALRWVREHIAAFGGDPGRLTAFGYSAGSASLSLLLCSPQGAGLFDRAILQSPGAARPLACLADAEQAGLAVGADLQALRQLPAAEVLARNALLVPRVRGLTTPRVLRPIRDGWLLPEDERPVLLTGRQHALPLVVGSVADEGSSLTRSWPVAQRQDWQAQLQANFGALAGPAAAVWPAAHDDQARSAVAQMFADTQFNYGARLLARANAPREPRTWKYLFQRRAPGAADGPHHGAEVPYVFGTLAAEAGEEDRALSRTMRQAWVRFAADGDPGLAGWERYQPGEDNHLAFDAPLTTGAGWRRGPLDFLDRFFL